MHGSYPRAEATRGSPTRKSGIQRMDELVFVRLGERNENIYAHPLFNNCVVPSNYMRIKGLSVPT